MRVGSVGLGNVGKKLAGSLLRNGIDLTVRDLDQQAMAPFLEKGAKAGTSGKAMAEDCDVIITCLPSPAISAAVLEDEDGVLAGLSAGKIWAEMSTTDADEVKRLAQKVEAKGARAIDCPVSGGCHRADTGNISIFGGADRETFEKMLPLLTVMGRRILHTGPLGSASILKVATNYLATANLVSVAEALTTMKAVGLDMNTTYEAFKISSGTSFVHETEGQIILNGSRDINFTMDLVLKDIGLFHEIAEEHNVPVELSPLLVKMFRESIERYGSRELSPNIIRRFEEPCGFKVLGTGFPAEMVDDEPEEKGAEVIPANRG